VPPRLFLFGLVSLFSSFLVGCQVPSEPSVGEPFPPMDPDVARKREYGSVLDNDFVRDVFKFRQKNELSVKGPEQSGRRDGGGGRQKVDAIRLWRAVCCVLKGAELALLDKKEKRVVTDPSVIKEFDDSERTTYVVDIRVIDGGTSIEDSLCIGIKASNKADIQKCKEIFVQKVSAIYAQ
jgi:hypothetical protein